MSERGIDAAEAPEEGMGVPFRLEYSAGRVNQPPRHMKEQAHARKIVHPFASRNVDNHQALDEPRFVVTALPLFHPHLLLHTLRQSPSAEGLHHQRDSSQRRQGFWQRLGIKFKAQGRGGGRRLGDFARRKKAQQFPPR